MVMIVDPHLYLPILFIRLILMRTQVTTVLASSTLPSFTQAKSFPAVTASEAGVELLQKRKNL